MKQSKKRKRENAGASSYSCAPPDSVRACGHKGIFLFYLATTMMLLRSPILIPSVHTNSKLWVYGAKRTERTASPDEFRLTFLYAGSNAIFDS